tara:strand:- start:593 stop:2131 length:1539 start_codon:yes stop_codon:yes gene_type:complete
MKEGIDDELIDIIYNKFNDDTPKGPDKEEYELPEIIQEWVKTGEKYSKYNEFPLKMCYFNILGQIAKDFVQIPNDGNKHDTRLHFIWLQTARTGKSAVWGFMNGVLQGTYTKINAHRENALKDLSTEEQKKLEKYLKKNNIFGITVYTSAALIGTFIENDKFIHISNDDFICNTIDDDALNICNCESEDNPRKLFIPGALHGSGIAHWDEFESSGIFNLKKHNEDMLVTFQTFMNNIDIESEGHVITKYLAGVTSLGKCDCQRSLYATSYVPQNLAEVIRNSGVLQRAFIYVREVPSEVRRDIHNHIIDTMGEDASEDIDLSKFITHFSKIYSRLLKKSKDTKPTDMMTLLPEVKEVLKQVKTRLDDHIKNSLDEIKESVDLFMNNLIIYHIKIATLITISRGSYTISSSDAWLAGEIIEKAYKELVGWLEQGIRIQASTLSNKSGLNIFVQVYMDSTKNEDGYIEKDNYMDKVGAKLAKAPATVYRYYKQINHNFDETNIGRTKYIKYIGD